MDEDRVSKVSFHYSSTDEEAAYRSTNGVALFVRANGKIRLQKGKLFINF